MNKINRDLSTFLLEIGRCLDSAEIQSIYHAYKDGDHSSIVDKVWSPHDGDVLSHVGFATKYLSSSLLRKSTTLNLGLDTPAVALEAFLNVETHNRATNLRGNSLRHDNLPTGHSPLRGDELVVSGPALLDRARYWVDRILGPLDIDHAVSLSEFSQGASDDLTRCQASSAAKFLGAPTCTPAIKSFAAKVMATSPLWSEALSPSAHPRASFEATVERNLKRLVCVPGDKFSTVKKDAKTDRTICLQPRMNLYLQKGAGSLIKRRLKSFYATFGLDFNLSRSFEKNKRMAQEASIKGHLVTVDGREASNRWTTFWVEDLLGNENGWFEYLNALRCHYTEIPSGDGGTVWHKNEMFMAMGNGFTFELQTVLFLSLGLAAVEQHNVIDRRSLNEVICFGDDLIVPQYAYAGVRNLYAFTGHAINERKTFVTGKFRESCGGHYYGGYDVEPFELNDTFDPEKVKAWYMLFNLVRLWEHRVSKYTTPPSLMAVYRHIVKVIKKLLPKKERISLVPFDFIIDGGLYMDLDEARYSRNIVCVYGFYTFKAHVTATQVLFHDAKSQTENNLIRVKRLKRTGYDVTAVVPEWGGYLDYLNNDQVTFNEWDRGTSIGSRTLRTITSSRWSDFPPSLYRVRCLLDTR